MMTVVSLVIISSILMRPVPLNAPLVHSTSRTANPACPAT